MGLPAILAAGSLVPLGAQIATDAVSAVSDGFADLLKGTLAATSASADIKSRTDSRPAQDRPQTGPADSSTAPIDTVRLQTSTRDLVSSFRGRLDRLLAEQGIDRPDGLQLQLDPFGTIRVVGGSADSGQIEQIINDDPQLGDLFRAISANLALLTAAEEAVTLPARFAADSLSALGRSPHLFPAERSPVVKLADAPAPATPLAIARNQSRTL